jgi:DNA-directed RNA polymerase specialized sigma24 family protein
MSPPDPSSSQAGHSGTDWSMILDAGDSSSPTQATSINAVVRRYVTPIHAFVRASGCTPDETNDVVQGFLADVLLQRRLLADASPKRGRFRSLLFQAIRNYLIDRHRHDSTLRRQPADRVVFSLDEALLAPRDHESSTTTTPEHAFTTHWVAAALRTALSRTRAELEASHRHLEWSILDARIIRPMLDGSEPASHVMLAARFELPDRFTSARRLVVAKGVLAKNLRAVIGETLTCSSDIQDEIKELLRLLDRRRS